MRFLTRQHRFGGPRGIQRMSRIIQEMSRIYKISRINRIKSLARGTVLASSRGVDASDSQNLANRVNRVNPAHFLYNLANRVKSDAQENLSVLTGVTV